MNRYTLLVILCLPLIVAGLTSALVDFKTKVLSRNRFILNVAFWLIVLCGLIAARFIYIWLYYTHHTTTSSMSLFDVIEFTAIIYLLYGISRARARATLIEGRFRELHQQLSIRLSEQKPSGRAGRKKVGRRKTNTKRRQSDSSKASLATN